MTNTQNTRRTASPDPFEFMRCSDCNGRLTVEEYVSNPGSPEEGIDLRFYHIWNGSHFCDDPAPVR